MDTNENDGLARICACQLALSVAIVWGLCVLAMGIVTVYTDGYAHKMVEVLGSIYWGYRPGSLGGAFIGLAWAVGDGFIGTFIIISLYNALRKMSRKCCCLDKPAGKPDQQQPAV